MAEQEITVVPNFDEKVEVRPYKFSFKTQILKDENGAEIGKTKRATVELQLPVPSVKGLVHVLECGDKKQLELLQDAAISIVLGRARELVNEREDINQDNFPFDQVSWETIANMPDTERRGRGIPKETWEEFAADYINVMPQFTGKSPKQIENAAEILVDKFNKLKVSRDYKKVVRLLLDQLAIYLDNAPNAETYMDCVTFLTEKGTKILTAEEVSLLEAL